MPRSKMGEAPPMMGGLKEGPPMSGGIKDVASAPPVKAKKARKKATYKVVYGKKYPKRVRVHCKTKKACKQKMSFFRRIMQEKGWIEKPALRSFAKFVKAKQKEYYEKEKALPGTDCTSKEGRIMCPKNAFKKLVAAYKAQKAKAAERSARRRRRPRRRKAKRRRRRRRKARRRRRKRRSYA